MSRVQWATRGGARRAIHARVLLAAVSRCSSSFAMGCGCNFDRVETDATSAANSHAQSRVPSALDCLMLYLSRSISTAGSLNRSASARFSNSRVRAREPLATLAVQNGLPSPRSNRRADKVQPALQCSAFPCGFGSTAPERARHHRLQPIASTAHRSNEKGRERFAPGPLTQSRPISVLKTSIGPFGRAISLAPTPSFTVAVLRRSRPERRPAKQLLPPPRSAPGR